MASTDIHDRDEKVVIRDNTGGYPTSLASTLAECTGCRLTNWRHREVNPRQFLTLRDLVNNGQECSLCRILSSGILRFFQDHERLGWDDFMHVNVVMVHDFENLEISFDHIDDKITIFCSEYHATLASRFREIPVGNPSLPLSTSSLETLSWVVQQVLHCKSSHARCQIPDSEPSSVLPSRVLDVSSSTVRLYESPPNQVAPYAALSHCWGTKPLLKTVTSNFTPHAESIAWSELPRTFQEAIQLTRALGLRFLWIDSLCIIQDDQNDWRREAASMASIYHGADIVISASASQDAQGGLFRAFPDTHKSVSSPKQMEKSMRDGSHSIWGKPRDTVTLPTSTRGWITQERILANRVMHFGPEEVIFECPTSTICQCTPAPPPPGAVDGQELEEIGRFYTAREWRSPKSYYHKSTWQQMTKADLPISWYNLVEDYSLLELTLEEDIFPAIAGVASEYNKIRKDSYIAGLWRGSLCNDLLWVSRSDRRVTKGRSSKWRAPSWSWAAVTYPVCFRSISIISCEVVDVACETTGPDPLGQIASGLLTLRGRLVPARMKLRKDVEIMGPHSLVNLEPIGKGFFLRESTTVDDESECRSLCASEDGGNVFLIYIGSHSIKDDPGVEWHSFLLLAPAMDGRYKRVGLATMLADPEYSGFEPLMALGEDATVTII
ncbi:heterokaryon incompatibility protein-domain-containing protein [Podospora australis]|uniref:Heterokaryon incompatibility protein-domain-containing protein n=1 Tax=Podospora australis TaxID=1536484 RepID=A0AAN6WRK3_9PEZI|nr:heterokaryon incompatibility protein-domain-containing protein [Podospora australis]